MSRPTREHVVQALDDANLADKGAARIGDGARYRCEYCGRDLLASVDNYRMWQEDHIIPESLGGEQDDMDNLALCCRSCNMPKGRWNPRCSAHDSTTREGMIQAVRDHLYRHRAKVMQEEVIPSREIAGRSDFQ